MVNQMDSGKIESSGEEIKVQSIEKEMKYSYINYAMSVIIGRALPSVLDGLKPVQRRILYTMYESNITHDKAYKKSARTVGEVLGKYHPHGDIAIYDALVRMGQPFNMRYPLIEGQGNFGSIDGDSPAAMRYTEARLTKYAEEILEDLDKDTVEWVDNFDSTMKEPLYLPSKAPNLILNGSSGIAVAMATMMVPHNMVEVVNAILSYIDNPNMSVNELMEILKGPDFPTGGIIYGSQGIKNYYVTGKGSITIRAKTEEKKVKEKTILAVKEIPYMVDKSKLIESIVEAIKNGKVNDVQDIRDESDRDGINIILELKKNANPEVVKNQLYKHTRMESVIGVNNVALVDNRPRLLSMFDLFDLYIKHRIKVIVRRYQYTLMKDKERLNILEGLLIAIQNIDDIISLIKGSNDTEEAFNKIKSKYSLNDPQVKAILDMKLQRLTGLEVGSIINEKEELLKESSMLEKIIASEVEQKNVIKKELKELADKYGDERRTEIIESQIEQKDEDLIPNVKNMIFITEKNYIKRNSLVMYKTQHRGGQGTSVMDSKVEDNIVITLTAYSHDYILLFSSLGKVYKIRCFEIPESSKQARGKPIIQLLPTLQPNEQIRSAVALPATHDPNINLLFATKKGLAKVTKLEMFVNIRSNGIKAITLEENDELVYVIPYNKNEDLDVMMVTRKGMAVRFAINTLRAMGRSARGVKGITVSKEDYVVAVKVVKEGDYLLTISTKGFGKRTLITNYRKVHRGAKGVKAMKITPKTGEIACIDVVNDNNEVFIFTKMGKVLRIEDDEIKIISRNTMGTKLKAVDEGDEVIRLIINTKESPN